jgi:hypothetical protein
MWLVLMPHLTSSPIRHGRSPRASRILFENGVCSGQQLVRLHSIPLEMVRVVRHGLRLKLLFRLVERGRITR